MRPMRGAGPDSHPPARDNPAARSLRDIRMEHSVSTPSIISPHVRHPLCHNRTVRPKLLFLALALLLGATAGYPQWLETQIALPDSLGGALYPTCLTTDTSERYVYIGDYGLEDPGGGHVGGGVYVVDAEARTRVAKIPFGFISAVCTNTRQNKVYAADYAGNRVFVISCATNQVVATIPTGANPLALCYNSTDDKVYVANGDSNDLTVIDCASDNVIKTIRFGESPAGLCYNPASNRVFCEMNDTLVVIDGASDSVAAVHAGVWWGHMTVDAVANKVYLDGVALDGTTGVVLDTLKYGWSVSCLNSRTQKLYTCDKDDPYVHVFDCIADTPVARLRRHVVDDICSMACDTVVNRVYVACNVGQWGEVLVVDGVADTTAAWLPGPYWVNC